VSGSNSSPHLAACVCVCVCVYVCVCIKTQTHLKDYFSRERIKFLLHISQHFRLLNTHICYFGNPLANYARHTPVYIVYILYITVVPEWPVRYRTAHPPPPTHSNTHTTTHTLPPTVYAHLPHNCSAAVPEAASEPQNHERPVESSQLHSSSYTCPTCVSVCTFVPVKQVVLYLSAYTNTSRSLCLAKHIWPVEQNTKHTTLKSCLPTREAARCIVVSAWICRSMRTLYDVAGKTRRDFSQLLPLRTRCLESSLHVFFRALHGLRRHFQSSEPSASL
jgi:hypothetical protein